MDPNNIAITESRAPLSETQAGNLMQLHLDVPPAGQSLVRYRN